MKNIFTALIFSTILTFALYAQNENPSTVTHKVRATLDLQLAQHVGLNQWSSASYVNDGLPRTSATEIRGVLNILGKNFGVFGDMGVAIMPAPRMRTLDFDRMPMPHNNIQYFLRETMTESDVDGASAHFRMTFGVVGKIPTNRENLTVMPYAGFGFLTMPKRTYQVLLKESGTNMQYNTTYTWKYNGKNDEFERNPPLGFFNARMNFKYRLSGRSSIIFGVEYTRFLTTIDFHTEHVNTFNHNIRRDFTIEGNTMTMLGLSVGISF
jgi:hypothetical protein